MCVSPASGGSGTILGIATLALRSDRMCMISKTSFEACRNKETAFLHVREMKNNLTIAVSMDYHNVHHL